MALPPTAVPRDMVPRPMAATAAAIRPPAVVIPLLVDTAATLVKEKRRRKRRATAAWLLLVVSLPELSAEYCLLMPCVSALCLCFVCFLQVFTI